MRRPLDLVYLTSASYSGSTLLTLLLNTHPEIATVGELKAHTNSAQVTPTRCSCGNLVRDCSFWRRIQSRLANAGSNLDLRRFGTHFGYPESRSFRLLAHAKVRNSWFELIRSATLKLPPFARPFQAILRRNVDLIQAIVDLEDARYFLDSSKDVVRLSYLIAAKHWNLKVIRLIRDGRGSVNSALKHHPAKSAIRAARQWRGVQVQFENLARQHRDLPILTVRYEDLTAHPVATLSEVARFLGIDDNFSLHPDPTKQHVFGNVMRTRPFDGIATDESWQSEFSQQNLLEFESLAGIMNRRLGYGNTLEGRS